jgi:hypothetical protein
MKQMGIALGKPQDQLGFCHFLLLASLPARLCFGAGLCVFVHSGKYGAKS